MIGKLCEADGVTFCLLKAVSIITLSNVWLGGAKRSKGLHSGMLSLVNIPPHTDEDAGRAERNPPDV